MFPLGMHNVSVQYRLLDDNRYLIVHAKLPYFYPLLLCNTHIKLIFKNNNNLISLLKLIFRKC